MALIMLLAAAISLIFVVHGAYLPKLGWAIAYGREHDGDAAWDRHEAEQIYTLLEEEIIPMYYRRDQAGIPIAWIE